jgi:radical SAM superfamily enzyme YgiQ (UPF0313 family)
VSVLLLSTYDLGRQPFGLASPAAWLRRAGIEVVVCDLSRERLDESQAARATHAAFYLPMHTATRLALPVIDRIRAQWPHVTLCAYGLYAPLNESLLREHGVSVVLGPEAEEELVIACGGRPSGRPLESAGLEARRHSGFVPRLQFITPDRSGLPPLDRYAKLQMPDGSTRIAGATDASRGCKHRCRHCPIVPVYDGQFRVVPVDTVIADIDQQVARGAEHITFGDPDFFNGPTHARRIVEALHARHPNVTYDVTVKVQHLLQHRDLLPLLARTRCVFVTSAVEAVDDAVLAKLEKNHTRADFEAAVRLTRNAGVALSPTFVAFTPWTTVAGYRDLLDTVERLDLVDQVAPVQWGIRLLITQGSRLLELEEISRLVTRFDPTSLTYPWRHPEPRVDALQQDIARRVGVRAKGSRRAMFEEIRSLVAGERLHTAPLAARSTIPYLDEPWYC